jgi:DNA-3-methyladenine glycosylase II
MLLIFSLGRLGIMSLSDAGLRRAIKWLYNLEVAPNPSEMNRISNPCRPYSTVASLYLWEVINTGLVLEDSNIVL